MIETIIPKTGLETIKLVIADIVTNELTNQRTLAGATITPELPAVPYIADPVYLEELESFFASDGSLNLFIDKFNPVDDTEMNCILINPTRDTFENGSEKRMMAVAFYSIEVLAGSEAEDDEEADAKTNRIIQRISGAIKSILQSPLYVRLGLAAGTISHRQVKERAFYTPQTNEAQSYNGALISFEVEYDENSVNNIPTDLLEKNISSVNGKYRIDTTDL